MTNTPLEKEEKKRIQKKQKTKRNPHEYHH
jgi:hypothetical protein